MAKRKRYRVGEFVVFAFAGSTEKGKVTHINEAGRLTVDDGKYTYPVDVEQVINVIK